MEDPRAYTNAGRRVSARSMRVVAEALAREAVTPPSRDGRLPIGQLVLKAGVHFLLAHVEERPQRDAPDVYTIRWRLPNGGTERVHRSELIRFAPPFPDEANQPRTFQPEGA